MRINIVIISIIFLFMVGCSSECWTKPGRNEYRELRTMLTESPELGAKRFSELSVDSQITIFLYARFCPDDPNIRPLLIDDGERKIPYIVERIKTQEKLWDKGALIGTLIAINTRCKCIDADSDVIRELEEVSRLMDEDKGISANDTYKKIYKDTLDSLKHQLDED